MSYEPPGNISRRGSTVGKRANIRATARNTRTLVGYAQRDEMVARGLIPPTASVGQAQAVAHEMAKQQRAADIADAKAERVANASPVTSLIVLVVLTAPFVILALATGAAVWWWVTALIGGACLFGLFQALDDSNNSKQGA